MGGSRVFRDPASKLPWAIAGVAVVVSLLVAVAGLGRTAWPGAASGAGSPGGQVSAGGAPAIDGSALSPRERADAFFDHLMRAYEAADTAQIAVFVPMALQAYAQLGQLDNDARYHVGLIHARAGEAAAALAQADSLDAAVPGHLLAANLRYTVAQGRNDARAAERAQRDFLANYERELATGRPEYEAHRRVIETFHEQALRAVGGAGPGS